MFPWLAMGHLLPFLGFSKLLAHKGHKVSFISTPKNIDRLSKLQPNLSASITFVSLTLPPISGLPLDSESSMDVAYNKQQSLKAAFDLLEVPVTEFLQRSSPDWVIYDFASHWLPPIATNLGIFKAYFSIFNAAALCVSIMPPWFNGDLRSTPEEFTVAPPWIPFKTNIVYRYHEITKFLEKNEEDITGVSDLVRFGYSIGESDAIIIRSYPEFEPEWLSLLGDLYSKQVFPIRIPPLVIEDDNDATWVRIKEWLDKQRINSVVYVALGTEASLSQEDLIQLALGLEKSEASFFLVLRNESHIPEGFKERVEGRGIIHIGWVPQTKILSHESVGGFLTHCGWSSVIEGLGLGRSLILLPVLNDQGINARLLHEKGLGVEVPRNERDGSFDSNSVAESVRLAMMDDAFDSTRAKAKSLFGNMDESINYAHQLIDFLISKVSPLHAGNT